VRFTPYEVLIGELHDERSRPQAAKVAWWIGIARAIAGVGAPHDQPRPNALYLRG
jgi:hypothetical protein